MTISSHKSILRVDNRVEINCGEEDNQNPLLRSQFAFRRKNTEEFKQKASLQKEWAAKWITK